MVDSAVEKKRKAAEANSAAVVAVSTAVAKKSNKGNLKWEKKEQNIGICVRKRGNDTSRDNDSGSSSSNSFGSSANRL